MLMPRHPVPTPSMPTLIHDDYPLNSDTRERAKALAEKLGSLDLRIGYGLSRRWSGGRGGPPDPNPNRSYDHVVDGFEELVAAVLGG
jgi:hypothetical protein